MLSEALPDMLGDAERERFDDARAELVDAGVPAELAAPRRRDCPSLLVHVRHRRGRPTAPATSPNVVMATYFRLGGRLELTWLRDRILELPRDNRWQTLARAALRDDLYSLHRALTQEVLSGRRGP